jgi:hypothetical protein
MSAALTKERIMQRNDDHLDAEVIELGVASEVTKGSIVGPLDTKGGRDFGASGIADD